MPVGIEQYFGAAYVSLDIDLVDIALDDLDANNAIRNLLRGYHRFGQYIAVVSVLCSYGGGHAINVGQGYGSTQIIFVKLGEAFFAVDGGTGNDQALQKKTDIL